MIDCKVPMRNSAWFWNRHGHRCLGGAALHGDMTAPPPYLDETVLRQKTAHVPAR
jgi:hypothetical protein